MNTVVDIGHPAHVHLFRNFILIMREKGHEVLITAADKDIAFKLLEAYGLDYVPLGSAGKGLMKKVISVATLDYALFKAARDFKPDLFIGHTSIRCTHVAKWLNAKSLILADTEATIKEHMLYYPFASWVVSPQSFERHFGEKHIRYAGCHELAYLHPRRFTPDINVARSAGLAGQKYFILRFISWDATHDFGHRGFSYEGKIKLINMLKYHGRVLISSEEKLPMEFEKYRFSMKPEDMHNILASASMCISEGATMASEAAVLGVPSMFISSLMHGVTREMSEKYELIASFEDENKAIKRIEEWLSDDGLRGKACQKRDRFLKETVDLSQWLVDFVQEQFDRPGIKENKDHVTVEI